MSSFFSSLFGSNKNKKTKQNVSIPKNEKKVEKPPDNEDEEIPVFSRRISLSKSGRMKEHKRRNVAAVTDFPIQNKDKKTENDINSDLPDSDIFDTHGIIEEIKSSLEKEKK